ncbi:MAG: hypothetical protein SWI22_11645, partial [Pseudomonadota bacterium]|nr:hypothetical protein [Pseudomonadota bacterium]
MFDDFTYETLALEKIHLDKRNPRIVTLQPLKSESAIIEYMFAHEALGAFIAKIALEKKNEGAERPYAVAEGDGYVVVEGNTRIAAYKLLAGISAAPSQYAHLVPSVDEKFKASLLSVDCSVAPSREAMLPIMADAHFGLGDKSKWGYLGSRKAVYDEYKGGKTVATLAGIFKRPKGKIRDYILEYTLYLEALKLKWSSEERAKLLDPGVEFNPPVRFLQGEGHLDKVGLTMDRESLKVVFSGPLAKKKFQHLVRKLVIEKPKGMGATAQYANVFKDFAAADYPSEDAPESGQPSDGPSDGEASDDGASDDGTSGDDTADDKPGGTTLKAGALFSYPVKKDSLTLKQLMKEAAEINANKLPASATALLRSLLESILKHIIDEQNANPDGKQISLEMAIDRCLNTGVTMSQDDRKILKDFKKGHLDYVNLGVHGNLVPSASRVFD